MNRWASLPCTAAFPVTMEPRVTVTRWRIKSDCSRGSRKKMVAGAGFEPMVSPVGSVGPEHSPLARRPLRVMSRRSEARRSQIQVLLRNEKFQPTHKGFAGILWLRGQDLNLRPSGYEPDELPNCSIPRCKYKWRRKRDSNPRAGYPTSRFSRPVPSTRLGYFSNFIIIICKI